jgi:glycosyltransferase involved in cell wall biosynthesis
LRILYFADIRFPLERANGIQTMETCHALARRGHFVSLVVRPDTHSPSRDPFEYYGLPLLARLRVEYVRVSGPPVARRAQYLAFTIGRILGRSRADVVLTRDLGAASVLLRVPGALRPKLVYESHGYAPDVAAALPDLLASGTPPGPGKLARLERREAQVWRGADGYVTITAGLAADLEQRFGRRGRMAVVPDGTRLHPGHGHGTGIVADRADRARGTRPDEDRARATGAIGPVVAYAGHLYAWKGVDVLLEAIAQLPGVGGLIVGGHEKEPDLARLKDQATRLGIAGRVRFTGLVPPSAVAGQLRASDVLVLPNPASAISTRFTSPLKLFEYMAAGRPIVASDLPAIREVLRHDESALLVAPGDPAALAAGVRRVVNDHALAERLASRALAAVEEYSWDRRGERLDALLDQVIHPIR